MPREGSGRMRMGRIAEAGGYYHIVSRVIDRQMLFDDNEKERFRDLLHRVVVFSGVRLLTYAILDNHFGNPASRAC